MCKFSFVLIILLAICSCKKQNLISKGVEGGDVFYKDCTKLSLENFDSISSTISININGYPLANEASKSKLFLYTGGFQVSQQQTESDLFFLV